MCSGIAKAMDDKIETNKELTAAVEKFFGKQEGENTPAMKLAQVSTFG